MMLMLWRDPFSYPLTLNMLPMLFAAVMVFGLFRLGQLVLNQSRTNLRLAEQNRSVTQLIEEYEHRGGAWLWETDQHHRLSYVSTQIGMILGQRSEEHTSELQSLMRISYAVFCLKKKKTLIK